MAENKLDIHSNAFDKILEQEDRQRELIDRFPIGSEAWHQAWNTLDRILARKRAYENAVRKNRRGCWE